MLWGPTGGLVARGGALPLLRLARPLKWAQQTNKGKIPEPTEPRRAGERGPWQRRREGGRRRGASTRHEALRLHAFPGAARPPPQPAQARVPCQLLLLRQMCAHPTHKHSRAPLPPSKRCRRVAPPPPPVLRIPCSLRRRAAAPTPCRRLSQPQLLHLVPRARPHTQAVSFFTYYRQRGAAIHGAAARRKRLRFKSRPKCTKGSACAGPGGGGARRRGARAPRARRCSAAPHAAESSETEGGAGSGGGAPGLPRGCCLGGAGAPCWQVAWARRPGFGGFGVLVLHCLGGPAHTPERPGRGAGARRRPRGGWGGAGQVPGVGTGQ